MRRSVTRCCRHRRRGGFTLIEVITALAVTMVLIGSVAAAFIQIIRTADEAEAQIRASTTARSAVDAIARDLRALQLDGDAAFRTLVLTDRPLTYGDLYDNDGDGTRDEEFCEGLDNDFDWNGGSDDQHATLGGFGERPAFNGAADVGDLGVDEDCRFSADEITFIQPPGQLGTLSPRRRVTYRIGTFDGQDNVLLRSYVDMPESSTTEVVEPLAFDVLSLDILAWNANNVPAGPLPDEPYWTSAWDAASISFPAVRPIGAPFGVPPFKFPAAFEIRVTVCAERVPLAEIASWIGTRPIKTETLSTVVTVESVISDARYFSFLRD